MSDPKSEFDEKAEELITYIEDDNIEYIDKQIEALNDAILKVL